MPPLICCLPVFLSLSLSLLLIFFILFLFASAAHNARCSQSTEILVKKSILIKVISWKAHSAAACLLLLLLLQQLLRWWFFFSIFIYCPVFLSSCANKPFNFSHSLRQFSSCLVWFFIFYFSIFPVFNAFSLPVSHFFLFCLFFSVSHYIPWLIWLIFYLRKRFPFCSAYRKPISAFPISVVQFDFAFCFFSLFLFSQFFLLQIF